MTPECIEVPTGPTQPLGHLQWSAVYERLMRLLRHSAVYGLGSVASKLLAIVLVPVYVRFVEPREYGIVETILVIDLFVVAVLKLGMQNSLMRFWYDEKEAENPVQVVRTAMSYLYVAVFVGAALLVLLSAPLADLLLGGPDDARFVMIGAFGVACSTFWQTWMSIFRLQQRAAWFGSFSLINIATSAGLTLWFVVGMDAGATGLLLGNFLGTFVLLPVLAGIHARYIVPIPRMDLLRRMFVFGVPTTPMAIAAQGLAMVDRLVLSTVVGLGAVGVYALAAKAAQVVMLVVLALQLSWQPFAYSIKDDDDARRTYALVMTYFVASIGFLVATVSLAAEPLIRVATVPTYYSSARLVPLLALAAGVYGMYFIAGIGASREKKTKFHFLVAAGALTVSIVANLLLVPVWGAMGAAVAAVLANATLTGLMFLRSQHVFPVQYHWSRMSIVAVLVGCSLAASWLLPGTGATAVVARVVLVVSYPLLLAIIGFFPENERAAIRRRLPGRSHSRA